jgi:DNA-binding response OmpR family regulator
VKLLIVEDDPTLNGLMCEYLVSQGYTTLSATRGEEALKLAEKGEPDLVLLDIMMPGMDGWEVIRQVRGRSNVPVLFVTGKGTTEDVIQGFKLGADDYVKKPVSLEELGLRVAAVLRRAHSVESTSDSFDDGQLQIDTARRTVTLNGQPVRLTPTEFRLLSYLVRHRDRAVPRAELLTEVWGPLYAEDVSNLQVYIRYLREKLGDISETPRYIHTTWGIGYRFGSAG